jgi:hypothetical protein
MCCRTLSETRFRFYKIAGPKSLWRPQKTKQLAPSPFLVYFLRQRDFSLLSIIFLLYLVRPARMRSSFPLLEPGSPRFFGGMKTVKKPHASRNYTQDH